VLKSTKTKAKRPVSAAPPNSMESEMDVNWSECVQLSQSATDIGVHIELPDGEIESVRMMAEVVSDSAAQVASF